VNESRSSRYHRLRRRAGYAAAALWLGATAALLLTPSSARLRDLVDASPALYALVFVFFQEAVAAPVTWYRTYRLEREYGLSFPSPAVWMRDHAKAAGLTALMAMAIAELVSAAMRVSPAVWWLPAAAGVGGFAALLTSVAPLWILPLFSDVRPVQRAGLRQRLVALSERAGVSVLDVHEWRLGERTRRANAALVGIGATRRILLSNTLLADYTDDEIEVILAHEMGHHVHRDVAKSLVAALVVLMAGFIAADLALRASWRWLGFNGPADVAGLPVTALTVGVVWMAATPLLNGLSRRSERRADRFALELASHPEAFVRAMQRMAAQNLVEERPSRAALWMFHTHPSVEERIARARSER
jgi:STE24 endopeptidase